MKTANEVQGMKRAYKIRTNHILWVLWNKFPCGRDIEAKTSSTISSQVKRRRERVRSRPFSSNVSFQRKQGLKIQESIME